MCRSSNGREDPRWSRWLQGRADPRWSDGNPPVSRVSEYTGPGVRMAGNLKSPSLHPMNPKLGEGSRLVGVMRRSSTRWGTATVEKRRSSTRWGTATVEKSPLGRRPCVVKTLCGHVPYPRCGEVN
jgi:hypothetical protein